MWTSADGILWTHQTRLSDYENRTLSIFLESVVSIDDRLVTAGAAPFFGAFPPFGYAVAWVSTDGIGW